MNFQKVNNISGWIIFTIATLVYWLTVEQTASYWDCGEFIAVSYKLQVPHPPGAPLFLLIGRMFSFLAMGDVEQVAYWINISSVLASGFTILFLFWSIVMLGRKLLGIKANEEIPAEKIWLLMGAAAVGALAYTFSDSFWFSAVEAEVYAMSSFFTAFVFWAILKWELIEDESKANRWIILIAYMMGLSIGVHLLNLVTIPALGLIYYFKKYKPTRWGVIFTLLISGGIVIFINDLIIPGLPTIAGSFEIFFVNTLRMPFGSGALFFSLLLIAGLIYGIYITQKKGKVVWNTFLISTAFILIGYMSYAVVVIRSNYNPPIDENDPSDVMAFVRYLKREQYGSRPLFYGQYFTAGRPIDTKQGAANYIKGKDRYEIADRKFTYVYDPNQMTILPRIYSTDPNHQRRYREILGLREGQKPNFIDNMYFMFKHQLGWMYWRYFMWNFAGRESDIQNADWLGPDGWNQDLPELLANNRARNNYFMIPFLLGFIGLFYQLKKDPKNFAVVGLLFFLTGAALVLYLNSPPVEPRERDYIYVGSFYAFAIWIGFSVLAIANATKRFIKKENLRTGIATALCMIAPVLMAKENWDDHDRSHRFFSVDSAKNYLDSCAPNGIIFTGGDNDTFPLWYVQEVEGFRTDLRAVVLSYYNTDWYIAQSKRRHYESEPFPYTLTIDHYRQGGPNDYLPFEDMGRKIESIDVGQYINLLKRNDPLLRYPYADNVNRVPSRTFTMKVDKERVRALGFVPEEYDSLIVDQMVIRLKGNALQKQDLAFLDLLSSNNWERPLYLNNTSMAQINLDLERYAIQEGNAYRIIPVENPSPRKDFVNVEVSYQNMMNKFNFRGLDDERAYYNEDYRGFVLNHRSSFNSLAEALLDRGDINRGGEVLLRMLSAMPDKAVPYDYTNARTVDLLFRAGEEERAIEMAKILGRRSDELAEYYLRSGKVLGNELQKAVVTLMELQRILYKNGLDELAAEYEKAYEKHALFMRELRMF
ncbi:MAG TPA: DUF2723 domain-containing protein [Cyclobacteriaceae bacterium]|nr:DUF2723 domain-containing protein [Cyclobacteriaceae bacterium]